MNLEGPEQSQKRELIRAKVPLRISFGGGGTDVSPYAEEHGGSVLSCTIDKYTYATLVPHGNDRVSVRSLDYDIFTSYNSSEEFSYDGNLDLVKGALKVMGIRQGIDVLLHSDMPPGSGLGTSSSMTVALVALFRHWKRLPMTNYEIAELAYHIEREEVGIKGGKQDQYAVAFGGFNYIEFSRDAVVVNPLRIMPHTLNELQYRLMLCYTGKRRVSAGIIEEQISNYVRGKEETIRALHQTKKLAIEMKNALLLGKLDEFGIFLHEGWLAKKNFSSKMTSPHIDELYEVARKNGALGGKLLGAGGGGYLLFLCQFDKWHQVAKEVEQNGGKVVGFACEFSGLQTWQTNG